MTKLGLFVLESLGHLLGIDGAGFDFYGTYWMPLYKLRGLQWQSNPLISFLRMASKMARVGQGH